MTGEVVYLYAFDVANEIATPRVKEILANQPFPFEIRTDHTFPRDVPLYRPLAIEPPALSAPLRGNAVRLLIRVYSVGVVSITMRVSVAAETLPELLPFHRPVLDDGQTLDQVARHLCAEVCKSLDDAIAHGSPPSEPEAYTVFCLSDLGAERDANRWLSANRRGVAELLTEAESGALSEMQINEVLRVARSYANTDMVVIDWDSALVVDLTGYVDDVLYVLELANLQLRGIPRDGSKTRRVSRPRLRGFEATSRGAARRLYQNTQHVAPVPRRRHEIERRGDPHQQVFWRLVSGPRLSGRRRAVLLEPIGLITSVLALGRLGWQVREGYVGQCAEVLQGVFVQGFQHCQ